MPTARTALAAAPLGNGIAGVFGGNSSSSSQLQTNEVYSYATNTWSTRAPMPTARNYLAAASLGNGIAGVFGGNSSSSSQLQTNEVYSYATNTWSTKAPMPTARAYLAAAPLGDGIAGVFGGVAALAFCKPTKFTAMRQILGPPRPPCLQPEASQPPHP
ncbi:Kelch repeat-containing protein [Thermus thermophilus]|uniref:Kelch repeat-containing protein n=1 Tax=Thermus thermophilus TaxID=274 RepID=UPI0033901E20